MLKKHGEALDSWMEEYDEEMKKHKPQDDGSVDAVTLSSSFTPDTYFRGNP